MMNFTGVLGKTLKWGLNSLVVIFVIFGARGDLSSDHRGITPLACLNVEMLTDGTSNADTTSLISSNKDLYDIYTGKLVGIYAGERTLYFDTHREGRQERILVKF